MLRPYIHSRGIPDPITGCIHSCSILPPITRCPEPYHAQKWWVSPPNRLRVPARRPQHVRMERPWHPRVSMHRRSLRLRGHDYSSPGAYFVTICACSHLFGRVRTAEMILNRFGEIARQCWTSIPSHFPHVRIDAFVVMPDHVHGILLFGARYPRTAAIGRIGPGSLGAVVRSFTSAVASRINALRGARVGGIWQRNYFDQVIRNRDDLNQIGRAHV